MYGLIRGLLFQLPAETAHHLGIRTLGWVGRSGALARRLRAKAIGASGEFATTKKRALPSGAPGVDLRVRIAGLEFAHPIALAAGLDKDAQAAAGLFALGFSAVEIGTVTPRPQPGNESPRVFRIPEHQALINRMGFNNAGVDAAAERLRQLRWRPGPVGANIGKNKVTPIEAATSDYVQCVERIGAEADYVVVNASSPNTPGLRQLQEPEQLEALLRTVRERMDAVAAGKPLFLKIAPDLGLEAVDAIVDVAVACRLDGLIATNTTLTRPVVHPVAQQAGGFSGRGLRELSTRIVARAFLRADGRLPIIGVGGVFNAADVYEKLRAGASVVQLYTGFIYGGPSTVSRMLEELPALLRRDGLSSVTDAIGRDAAVLAGGTASPERSPARRSDRPIGDALDPKAT